ncbi:unspecific monooxygenase [Micromonospora pisi]|uniref:Unspecific monooxygenase n=1 Tax=Micromonospora pisi TaxID=589240 RepID=A0A495JVW5_9ACTN|nr:cytochrome P450 [Micromonospora pisi]RKR93011.1 unspecific monooxygenase [Micromonospora pisi]
MANGADTDRPPGPRGHWLMGNIPEYDADRIGFLRRNHDEYGDVFSYDERTVFVIDPDLTHDVLARTNRDFLTELAPFDTRRDIDQAAEQGDSWMSARRTVWPGLSHSAATEADHRTVEILDTVTGEVAGRECDVLTLTRTFTARSISEYCFGPDSAGIPELLDEALDVTRPFSGTSYQFPAWVPLRRNRRFFRAHRHTIETLYGIVRRRRASANGTSQGDLLSMLLGVHPEMPDRTVMSTLRGILMGGHGVPASALSSIVRELARRPRLAADLRAEAGGPAGAEAPPTARLPLAEAVVKEVLRLYPPVWLMTRTARTATSLGKWSLRPGDDVLLNPYLIHRDPRWWPRPDEFDPARWLGGQAAPGSAYLPFGAGPRVCLGSALTMRQLTLATSRLAQRFTIESPNAEAADPEFLGRLAPTGLRAQFRPISG